MTDIDSQGWCAPPSPVHGQFALEGVDEREATELKELRSVCMLHSIQAVQGSRYNTLCCYN